METKDALKWAFESDWGTDWSKDCMAMVQLAEDATRMTAEVEHLTDALRRVLMQGRIEGCMLCQCKDNVAAAALAE